MGISVESIKELRRISLASISDCKDALKDTAGDIEKAVQLLRKRGQEIAAKKQDRVAREGRIESYVHHGNKLGVLLELDCETDFVARNEEFCRFSKDIAMQIAACNPLYVKQEDIPHDLVKELKSEEKELYVKAHCLLEQPFIKDPSITIKDYLGSLIAKIGENVVIRRFMRYKIGE